jgi:DMSO reductase family type II enzyme chaperone
MADPQSVCGIRDTAASRSLLYAGFVEALAYPDADALEAIRSGRFAEALRQLLAAADADLHEGTNWQALRDAGAGTDELQAEYTRLFLAGADGPACALEEGIHQGTALQAMEEALRYYEFFGLSLRGDREEQPDHLKTELEFLHYLTYQESHAVSQGTAVDGLWRAQRDFIQRHPGSWVPVARQKLVTSDAMPFFVELMRLLERFFDSETRRLVRMLAATDPARRSAAARRPAAPGA